MGPRLRTAVGIFHKAALFVERFDYDNESGLGDLSQNIAYDILETRFHTPGRRRYPGSDIALPA